MSGPDIEGDKRVTQNPQVFRQGARVLASGHTWSQHVTLKGSLTPLPYVPTIFARGITHHRSSPGTIGGRGDISIVKISRDRNDSGREKGVALRF